MPKQIRISLGKIGDEIDKATAKLADAKGEVRDVKLKKELSAKIESLNEAKKIVRSNCMEGREFSYIIIIPPEPER